MLEHGLEGAVLALMREFRVEHVERDTTFDGFSLSDEVKTRTVVNELLDEPGGCEPVNVKIAPGHPASSLIARAF